MQATINPAAVMRHPDGKLSAEASELQWPPGQWPEVCWVGGKDFIIHGSWPNGAARIYAHDGEELIVFND